MKILFDIGHPAHVHLFKNVIHEMNNKGHEILITAREKEVTKQLLDVYGIPYTQVGSIKTGKINLILEWIYRDIKIFQLAKKFNPDILIGVLNPSIVHAGAILKKKTIIFTDSEPEAIKFPIADIITTPLADTIITLSSVKHCYGEKEIRINSYKELAYLHPNWFRPNPHVLENAGINETTKYVILRFVSWRAYHDAGRGGFDIEHKRRLVKELSPYIRVFISSEQELLEEFEQYRIPLPPEQMHNFLFFASLLISDSQTMTTEAAVLGTPAIRCNSFVGTNDMGNFIELERKYGLIYNYKSIDDVLKKSIKIISSEKYKQKWRERRAVLLQEKEDFTAFLIEVIENTKI